jgi:hypothetical protein
MFNETLAKLRHEEIMAEVEQYCLAASITDPQPPLTTRLMANVGEALSNIGESLQKRACVAQIEWELKHAR